MNYGALIDNQPHPAWLVEQRDKAILSTTKAIYQAIIDRLEAD